MFNQTNRWGAEDYIKKQVAAQWFATVDKLILEALNDSSVLREKIAAEVDRTIRAQITAAMKAVTGG